MLRVMLPASGSTSIAELPNIGSKSAAWLQAVGIHTKADLNDIGPAEAYVRVQEAGYTPSINLLWAMAGALLDMDWKDVPEHVRKRLKVEVSE